MNLRGLSNVSDAREGHFGDGHEVSPTAEHEASKLMNSLIRLWVQILGWVLGSEN